MRSPAGPFILDSCALIAYLRDEPGADAVAPAIEGKRPYIHAINLCEVYYDCARAVGRDRALQLLDYARRVVEIDVAMGPDFLIQVGDLKARGGIALADCFAAALAMRMEGTILTADHKEFGPLAASGLCRVEFFR